jgi:hypothetical protein
MQNRAAALISKDMILAYACVVLAGLVLHFSAAYPEHGWGMGGPPAFMPRILAGLLILFAILVAIEAITLPAPPIGIDAQVGIRVAIAAAIFFAAASLLPTLGFHVTATATAFGIIAVLTPTSDWTIKSAGAALAIAAGSAIVLHIVFARVAGVRLPAGILI